MPIFFLRVPAAATFPDGDPVVAFIPAVACVTAIADIPAVAGISAIPDITLFPDVAGLHVIAGVHGVVDVSAVAIVPAAAGVHAVVIVLEARAPAMLILEVFYGRRTVLVYEICTYGLLFSSAIGIWRNYWTIRLRPQYFRLRKNYRLPNSGLS